MLFAVEGGGFFSSSASGYSKGLTLLLLGQKNEDKPMRVAPWNQYQLVDQESDPDLQLASAKSRLARGCASFVCFGRTSAGPDAPSPLKVGPAQHQHVLPATSVSENKNNDDCTDEPTDISSERKESFKSSLKKSSNIMPASVTKHSDDSARSPDKECTDVLDHPERRKVQWTDACGSELAEIKEFEPSEVDFSDDEFENGTDRSCSCAIM